MTDDNRWTCKFCHKSFSHNYKYKTHLSRCLVHKDKMECENNMLSELKDELKEELKQELQQAFINMMEDIKIDMKTQLQQQQQQYQPRRFVNVF
jgi:hypothetical protein